MSSDSHRPPHAKLVKGHWYWDPPDRLRKSHNLKTKAAGADQAAAWAYIRILNRDHLGLGEGQAAVGSVAWVLEAFLDSERFKSLAPTTQKDYRWLARKVLQPIAVGARTFGELPAIAVRPRHADAIYSDLKKARGATTANYACRFARRVWKWAARREMVDAANPWSSMELAGIKPRTALWTPEQVDQVVAKAGELGRPSLGLATLIGYWFGHRQADVLGLTWSALDLELVETRKTSRTLPVNAEIYPVLAAALSETRAAARAAAEAEVPQRVPSAHVVVHERTGRPYNAHTFRHEWREVAIAAGITDELQFRDLRATTMTELSDSGADIISMSTHSGHKTPQMARRYARPTQDQFTNAAKKRLSNRAKTQS